MPFYPTDTAINLVARHKIKHSGADFFDDTGTVTEFAVADLCYGVRNVIAPTPEVNKDTMVMGHGDAGRHCFVKFKDPLDMADGVLGRELSFSSIVMSSVAPAVIVDDRQISSSDVPK